MSDKFSIELRCILSKGAIPITSCFKDKDGYRRKKKAIKDCQGHEDRAVKRKMKTWHISGCSSLAKSMGRKEEVVRRKYKSSHSKFMIQAHHQLLFTRNA